VKVFEETMNSVSILEIANCLGEIGAVDVETKRNVIARSL
jgi:hypothetical protein